MNWYLETLNTLIVRPILFYQRMPKGTWRDDSLSFAMITGWIISITLTAVFFINSYIPTGLSLIEGIPQSKLIIIIPVLSVMGVAFFAMTALILGGIFICALVGLMFFCAAILNILLLLLGGKGNFAEVFKASLFACGVFLTGLLNILLMILVKHKIMSFSDWINGERVIFYCSAVFIYGLFSILGRKTHNLPKWKAFLAASIPFIILVALNIILSAKVLPKLGSILG